MANPEHVKILKLGAEVWNQWRKENPETDVDLSRVDLEGERLSETNPPRGQPHGRPRPNQIDLSRVDLSHSKLQAATLKGALLKGAKLFETNLYRADLRRADLRGADLRRAWMNRADLTLAQVSGADFEDAMIWETVLARIDLSRAIGLEKCRHGGPSIIDDITLHKSGSLPVEFMRGCGMTEWQIAASKLHRKGLAAAEIADIGYEVISLRSDPILQCYSSFISYSHSDKQFARRLHNGLQNRGVRCWLDEHDLKPGDRILDVVNDAIRLHDKILLCCSESSLNSWWVKDEIRKAMERERRDGLDIIIPLMVDRYLLDKWEDGMAADLRSRLAADFTGWEHDNAKFEEQFERVVRALRAGEVELEKKPESML